MNCTNYINQGSIPLCWFVSIFHAVFFSDKIREYFGPSVENMRAYAKDFPLVKIIVEAYDLKTTINTPQNTAGICMQYVNFLNYIADNNDKVNTSLEFHNYCQNYYDFLQYTLTKTLSNDEYHVMFNVNRYIDFTSFETTGGRSERLMVPFLGTFLYKNEVLHLQMMVHNANDYNEKYVMRKNILNNSIATIRDTLKNTSPINYEIILITARLEKDVNMPDKIQIGENIYQLQSAIFGIEFYQGTGHAITGVVCGNDRYIIDSERGAFQLDWFKRANALDGYASEVKKTGSNATIMAGYESPYNHDTYVYLLANSTNGGGRRKKKDLKVVNFINTHLQQQKKGKSNKAKVVKSKKV